MRLDVVWLSRAGQRHAWLVAEPKRGRDWSLCQRFPERPSLDLRPDAPECPDCREAAGPTTDQAMLGIVLFEQARRKHGQ